MELTKIRLEINEKEIPLNPIMSAVLTNIISGFIEALKDIPKDKKTIKLDISF